MPPNPALARIGLSNNAKCTLERPSQILRVPRGGSLPASGPAAVHKSSAAQSKLPAPEREVLRISRLPVPCFARADWAERGPEEFLDLLLGPVSSVFARLTLVARFLDRDAGRYVVPLLGAECQCPIMSDVLHAAHEHLLNFWLSLSLSLKAADLALYLTQLEAWQSEAAEVAANKIRSGDLAGITPLNADPAHISHLILDAGLCLRCLLHKRRL